MGESESKQNEQPTRQPSPAPDRRPSPPPERRPSPPPDRRPSPPPVRRPSPPPSPALLSRPWRVSPPLNSEQLSMLKRRVENYSLPSELKTTQARILMLGPVGAGKSSFFNTINSIVQDRITQQSLAGSATGSLTMEYRQHQVRSLRTGIPLNFRLCDTCGVEKDKGPDLMDLHYLLEGNVPDGYKFSSTTINPDIEGFIHKPEQQDKVHCVVFIFDISSAKGTDQDTWDKLNQLQKRMNTKGIPRVILLTKIDTLLEPGDKDLSKVFFSKDVKRAVVYTSEKLRVPLGNVMPIKNYENEIYLDDQISCLALQAFDRMLGFAKDYLVNQHDLMRLSSKSKK